MSLLDDNFTKDEIRERKERFAQAFARSQNSIEASRAAFDNDFMLAFDWQHDPYVISRIEHYTQAADFAQAKLISKNEYLLRVQQMMLNDKTRDDLRLKFFQLFAEVQGYTGRNGNAAGMAITNAVIVMPPRATEAEWEEQSRLQQQKLIASVEH